MAPAKDTQGEQGLPHLFDYALKANPYLLVIVLLEEYTHTAPYDP